MFLLVELLEWMTNIHKVDWFLIFFGVGFWFSAVSLSETGLKHLLSMVGYTMTLNTIAILLIPVFGVTPHFWWAWGWTFAFIPVFNWWKPMLLIFTVNIILTFILYNNGWDKEYDKYGATGFTVPFGCLDWPCTDFSGGLYMGRGERVAAAKAKKAAAAREAKAKPVPPKPQVDPQLPLLPKEMYISPR